MIDLIYQVVKTILNKELRGNISPDEFNKVGKQAQEIIFSSYFDDANNSKVRENRGFVNRNHANVTQKIREKIDVFAKRATLVYNFGTLSFDLPADIYFINDNGLIYNNSVVEESQTSDFGYMQASKGASSTSFPIYEKYGSAVQVFPATITTGVTCRYVKTPADPKWTYSSGSGTEIFDISALDYQDFELHPSEFSNIVIQMVSYFGVNLREADVAIYADTLKKEMGENKRQQTSNKSSTKYQQ